MIMRIKYPLFLLSLFIVLFLSGIVSVGISPSYAQGLSQEEEVIIGTAENLFKAMKNKEYEKIWTLLSRKTQNEIVVNVRKSISKAGQKMDEKEIISDFQEAGVLAKSYWDAYLFAFNPDWVLEESVWRMGDVGRNTAEVYIKYYKSEQPAILKMFKEDGLWKAGLEETFGTRKWLDALPY